MKLLDQMNAKSLRDYCRKYRVPYRKLLTEIKRANPDVQESKARWAQGSTRFEIDLQRENVTWVGVSGMNI